MGHLHIFLSEYRTSPGVVRFFNVIFNIAMMFIYWPFAVHLGAGAPWFLCPLLKAGEVGARIYCKLMGSPFLVQGSQHLRGSFFSTTANRLFRHVHD